MALNQAQLFRRKQLLAKKQLRDFNTFLKRILKFPIYIDHISYDSDLKTKPAKLEHADKIQKVTVCCYHYSCDADLNKILDENITISIFSTQNVPFPVSIYNSSLTFKNPNTVYLFAQQDLIDSGVLEIGIFRLTIENPYFGIIFSDMLRPVADNGHIENFRKIPLMFSLKEGELLFQAGFSNQLHTKYINLDQLNNDLKPYDS
ncbi:MAG: hypothetical protein WC501_01905 [Candidatus Micrarchaeia archaeon]